MSKTSAGIEKRSCPRFIFATEEKVKGCLVLSNGNRLGKKAAIMDISRNGIGLALSKKENNGIEQGDRLHLERILAKDEETWIKTDLAMQVVWVLDHAFLDNVGFGCEFQNPSKTHIHQLVDFINSVFPERIE